MSDSLQPQGLYSPWNSPDQNTGVGSLSLLQGIFPTQDGTQASRIAGGFGGFFTSWATREKGLRCGMLSFYRLMNGWIILFQARGADFQGLDHRAPFGLLGWLQTGGCVIPYANTLQ